MSPRSSSTAFGRRKPSVVTSSTFGWSGQRASSAWSTRAVVLLPTATLPPSPMMNGERWRGRPRNVSVVCWSDWVAATRRLSRRDSGRYTSVTSLRSSLSFSPRSASSSCASSGSGVDAPQLRPLVPVEGAVAGPGLVGHGRSRYASAARPPRTLGLRPGRASRPPRPSRRLRPHRAALHRRPGARLRRHPRRRAVRRADRLRLRRPPVHAATARRWPAAPGSSAR